MPKRKKKNSGSEERPPGKLYATALATAKGKSLEALYTETLLPLSWLRKFRAGEIKNPSVNRVEIILKKFGHL